MGEVGRSLMVRHLSEYVRADDLRAEAEKFGEVRDVYIPRDFHSKRPKGLAFIEFQEAVGCEDAAEGMEGMELEGQQISVNIAKEGRKKPDDFRGGGGRGYGRDDRRGYGRYDDRRNGGYEDRRGGYNDRRGGYDDRGGRYDDRREYRGGGGWNGRRGGGYDDRRGGHDDDRRGGGYDDRRSGGYEDRRGPRSGGGYDDRPRARYDDRPGNHRGEGGYGRDSRPRIDRSPRVSPGPRDRSRSPPGHASDREDFPDRDRMNGRGGSPHDSPDRGDSLDPPADRPSGHFDRDSPE